MPAQKRYIRGAVAMPPTTRSRVAINGDDVMTDPIASAASSDIEHEYFAHHSPHRKAIVGGALIKVGAMRRPERLAPGHPPQQRDGRVGQIVERQQQGGCKLLMPGELQQAPAEQQPDRQAADVAEKDLCHRPVERRESEHRAAQRRGDDGRRCRKFTEPAEQDHRSRDRHDSRRPSSGRARP